MIYQTHHVWTNVCFETDTNVIVQLRVMLLRINVHEYSAVWRHVLQRHARGQAEVQTVR